MNAISFDSSSDKAFKSVKTKQFNTKLMIQWGKKTLKHFHGAGV